MNKITLKIDSSSSYDKTLEEFKSSNKRELEKKNNKDKTDLYLSNLHNLVNSNINTNFGNINSLIHALIPYASSTFKLKLENSGSGRRKTISMNKEIFLSIKSLLNRPTPNKAEIARQLGVSVVQVRKVAGGGYDKKYLSTSTDRINTPKEKLKVEINEGTIQKTFPSVPPFPSKDKSNTEKPDSITRPPMKFQVKSPLDL